MHKPHLLGFGSPPPEVLEAVASYDAFVRFDVESMSMDETVRAGLLDLRRLMQKHYGEDAWKKVPYYILTFPFDTNTTVALLRHRNSPTPERKQLILRAIGEFRSKSLVNYIYDTIDALYKYHDKRPYGYVYSSVSCYTLPTTTLGFGTRRLEEPLLDTTQWESVLAKMGEQVRVSEEKEEAKEGTEVAEGETAMGKGYLEQNWPAIVDEVYQTRRDIRYQLRRMRQALLFGSPSSSSSASASPPFSPLASPSVSPSTSPPLSPPVSPSLSVPPLNARLLLRINASGEVRARWEILSAEKIQGDRLLQKMLYYAPRLVAVVVSLVTPYRKKEDHRLALLTMRKRKKGKEKK